MIDALDRAIVRGELTVQYSSGSGDMKYVQYRSVAQMKEARAHAAKLLSEINGTARTGKALSVFVDGYRS